MGFYDTLGVCVIPDGAARPLCRIWRAGFAGIMHPAQGEQVCRPCGGGVRDPTYKSCWFSLGMFLRLAHNGRSNNALPRNEVIDQ